MQALTINKTPPLPRNLGVPQRSWWLEADRAEFSAAVEREAPRMRQSRFGGMTPAIVPGGLVNR
jgi:hypothetical protein